MQILSWISLLALIAAMGIFIYWAWWEEKARPRWVRLSFWGATAFFSLVFLGFTFNTVLAIPAQTRQDEMTADVIAGKKAWQTYQCINCHTLLGNGAYYASDLTRSWNRFVDRSGDNERLARIAMKTFLQNPPEPTATRRGMPKMPISDAEAVSLVAFLRWVSRIDTNGWPPEPVRPILPPLLESAATPCEGRGKELFAERGCTACHTVGEGKSVGPDLLTAAARYDSAFLVRWIRDPQSIYAELRVAPVNPGYPEMPTLEIDLNEATQIASYLRTAGEKKEAQ